MRDVASVSKKPYRYQLEWVSAEHDLESAQIMFDLVSNFVERDRGYVQGGFVGLMPASDVVPDSSLARDLSGV